MCASLLKNEIVVKTFLIFLVAVLFYLLWRKYFRDSECLDVRISPERFLFSYTKLWKVRHRVGSCDFYLQWLVPKYNLSLFHLVFSCKFWCLDQCFWCCAVFLRFRFDFLSKRSNFKYPISMIKASKEIIIIGTSYCQKITQHSCRHLRH